MDFGKCQDRFVHFSWSKIDSKSLGVKLKVFKRDDNKDFRLVQNVTVGVADFNRLIRLTNQLLITAENFGREENLSPVLIPTISKDKGEQFKQALKVIDVVFECEFFFQNLRCRKNFNSKSDAL